MLVRVLVRRPQDLVSDLDDFDEFYRGARDRLVGHVAALTGDLAEAQDHVQEAFVQAWERWERICHYDDPEGWVRRCAYNRAVSRWRRAKRLVFRPELGHPGPLAGPEQVFVLGALAKLPPNERRALVLHKLLGLSISDIAAEMSAPEGTVKSWLSRGRTRLAGYLASGDNDQEVNSDAG